MSAATLTLFPAAPTGESAKPYAIERRGTSFAPWCVVHRASGLTITVERPYPSAACGDLPPIEVANHRSREDAEAAAGEIDWPAVEARAALPKWQAVARREAERRDFDAEYQAALTAAREGRGPSPWAIDGMLHAPVCRVAPTLGRTDPPACPACGAPRP